MTAPSARKGARSISYQTFSPEDLIGPLNDVEKINAPSTLFVQGRPELARRHPRVSIVGSRNATALGLRRATQLAKDLVRRGSVIVSGLARGIDTAAHNGAIAAGGQTIGIIGTGLDQSYPKENAPLQKQIAEKYLLVSQFSVGSAVRPGNFPTRNRTMALFADATVIVEATDKSGSLHQGWEALRLGRSLFVMESAAKNDALTWPRELVKYGALILTRDSLDALDEILPPVTEHTAAQAAF